MDSEQQFTLLLSCFDGDHETCKLLCTYIYSCFTERSGYNGCYIYG